jgi:hypothetical protein
VPLNQDLSPSTSPPASSPAVSAIDNEFPTYRAISPHAVLSVVAGVLAIFCVVHLAFLVFAALAVLLGFYAERKIQAYSDVLTGRSLAQAGIGLGLVFGLGSSTMQVVQWQLRKSEATAFTKTYIRVLKTGTLDDLVWYKQHPDMRRDKSASEVKEEIVKAMHGPQAFEMEYGALKALKERADAAGQDVRFEGVEETGTQDLSNFATVVIAFHGPGEGKYPKKEEYALLYVKSARNDKTGKDEWWVDQVQYPYARNSFVAPTKAPDDGHGHAH